MLQDLLRACEILFGPNPQFSAEFLQYLQPGGLKSAYRKRVMETHPDRLGVLKKNGQQVEPNSFSAVQEAYQQLETFIRWRESRGGAGRADLAGRPQEPRRYSGGTTVGKGDFFREQSHVPAEIRPFQLLGGAVRGLPSDSTERFYHGPMPQRKLLFGTFLYYLGLTNWRTISRVLTLQRLGRPRLGEIGIRLGVFTTNEIDRILAFRSPGVRFGETALTMGVVTESQVQALLSRQRLLQKKFGSILLEKELVNDQELQELLYRFRKHNGILLKR